MMKKEESDWQRYLREEEEERRLQYREHLEILKRNDYDRARQYAHSFVKVAEHDDLPNNRKLIHVSIQGQDGKIIVLYHGPLPPSQGDILEHWSAMLSKMLTGDGK